MHRQWFVIAIWGSLMGIISADLKAQELTLEQKKIYNEQKVKQYYSRIDKSKNIVENSNNLPISIFFMNDNVCGYFLSRYKGPFAKGYNFSTTWTGFVTCLNFKGNDPEIVYVNYIYEHILKEKKPKSLKSSLKMASYYKKTENIAADKFQGPISYVAFDDKLLFFYTYDMEQGMDKVQKMELFRKLLLVKEYNSSLKLVSKQKIDLATIKFKKVQFGVLQPQYAGEVFVSGIRTIKINENRFAVIYNIVKALGRYRSSVALAIKIFDKQLNLVNEFSIDMPFPVGSNVDMIPSADGNNLYFAIPVVLKEEAEAKGFINKLMGTKEEIRAGLFLFIYNLNLRDGTYDFGVVNLGNPGKRVVSSVFKRSSVDDNSFLVGLMWNFNDRSYGADIVKIRIGEGNDFGLLDKVTVNLQIPEKVKQGLKKHTPTRHISDIYELNNHYLLLTGESLIIQNEVRRQDGTVSYTWYENSLRNPTLVIVNKDNKTTRENKLYVGSVLSYETYQFEEFMTISDFNRNLQQTVGFVDIGGGKDKVMAVFAVRGGSWYAPTQSKYLFISENSKGDVEVTRAKDLGMELSGSSSFGARTVTSKNGKVYGIFSINYLVPAAAEYKVKH